MSVKKILWVTRVSVPYDDFIMFHLDIAAFPYAPTRPFPSNSYFGQDNGWYCTLGVHNKFFTTAGVHLESWINGDLHTNVAKEIDGKRQTYANIDFNEISPPNGDKNLFAAFLFGFASNFDKHSIADRGDYQQGTRDGVSWTNSMFAKAGVPKSTRQRGGGTFLPNQNMFDPAIFSVPVVAPPVSDSSQLAPGHEWYVVQRGDSLSKIAMEYYRNYQKWEQLYNYVDPIHGSWNREQIGGNPNLIYPDTKLIVPPLSAIG